MLTDRELDRSWIERVSQNPEWTEPDPRNPAVIRAYGAIAEANNKVLRLVYIDRDGERIVLTVHFDRDALKKKVNHP